VRWVIDWCTAAAIGVLGNQALEVVRGDLVGVVADVDPVRRAVDGNGRDRRVGVESAFYLVGAAGTAEVSLKLYRFNAKRRFTARSRHRGKA
jgi:hypothetical protein